MNPNPLMNSLGFVMNWVNFNPTKFLTNSSIVEWLATGWYGQTNSLVNSLTYKQLWKFEILIA
jgi:hypothetical protein